MPEILPKKSRDAVRELLDQGLPDGEISRRTGVGRATVRRWRRRGIPVARAPVEIRPGRWSGYTEAAYAYLLGLYLGDGYVGQIGNCFSLVIACDLRYPELVEEASEAVSRFTGRNPSLQNPEGTRGVRVVSYWQGWPLMFPQFGPGKKHERKIELADWQKDIVDRHPTWLIRGLIHSDGSRCLNTFRIELKDGPKEYSYPRYFFTNYSADIRRIFCEACDLLGIGWSRSNWRNISISHRKSVALLDSFVGPKT